MFFGAVLFFTILAVPAIASADQLGDQQTFFVDSGYDHMERSFVAATLKNLGSHGYFYVEDDYFENLSEIKQSNFLNYLSDLVNDFDNIIYAKNRSVFGTEWSPGIDNDDKITILLTELTDHAGGYFNPNNEYLKEKISDGESNEREMIYLNAEFLDDSRMSGFLAHEFQHLITWYHKTKLYGMAEDIWLNEGRSEYAPTANGFDNVYNGSNLKARVNKFKTSPNDSLTEWANEIEDYPPANLFIQYLIDRFGERILKGMVENNKIGIESVNKALLNIGSAENFHDIFTDWTVANYLNDISLGVEKKYGYSNSNLSYWNFHLEPTATTFIDNNTVFNSTVSIKDWSSRRYEIKPADLINDKKDTLEFNFNGGDSKSFALPYVVSYRNGDKKVDYLNLDKNQDGKLLINDFGDAVSKLTIIPSSQVKTSGFGSSEPLSAFSYSARFIEPLATTNQKYPDGSILRAEGDKKVYLIENNERRWITSAEIFSSRYNWQDIQIVFSGDLADFELGEEINKLADDSLVKGISEKVYLVKNGQKRWVVNAFTFNRRGYQWENIRQISESELSSYSEGENILDIPLYPDGILIKGSSYKVYLISGGNKKWIASAEVFSARGYQWNKIITVSDENLNWYAEGERIE